VGEPTTMAAILWLNDQPLWASILVLVGGSIALSIIGTAVSELLIGEQTLSLNNVVGGFKFMFVSEVFAGFIGFLLFGVYDRYDQMRADVISEAGEITSLDRLAVAFPAATRIQLREGLKEYARQVVDVEWPQLRGRTTRMTAISALDTLDFTYAAVEPTTRKQREILKYSQKQLSDIRDTRGIRALRSLGSLQVLLWGVTLTATAITIVFPWMFGSPNVNATILMSILSTVLIASVVLVVLKLSYPFSGDYGIRPTPYSAFIKEVSARGS
jgi:Protein of unknown function (DUF4239)